MSNVLFIEPSYYCKYPPLGLMKIAYYHKEIRGDFVWFSKGILPTQISEGVIEKIKRSKYYTDKYREDINLFIDEVNGRLKNNTWDRVYVSTLFTYEWAKTIETIEYTKSLVDDINNIYVGGILATLLDEDLERATGIKPIKGLLLDSAAIGFDDGINIDRLTPDYSILDNVDYNYPASNAYYTYTTRGCGMNCEFCAVKTLEPYYTDYIDIKPQIIEITKRYGEKVVFTKGYVYKAVRASIAIPGIFAPAEHECGFLADGGLVDPVPVDLVRQMGADVVIGVNLGSKTAEKNMRNIYDVIIQSIDIMQNEIIRSRGIRADLLLNPDLSNINAVNFNQVGECIEIGMETARQSIDSIKGLLRDRDRLDWLRSLARRGNALR
jgi:hypothetical protein